MATTPIIVPYYNNLHDGAYFTPDGDLVVEEGGHIIGALNFIRGSNYEVLKRSGEVNPFIDSKLSKEQLKLWLKWLEIHEEYSEYAVLFMMTILGCDKVHFCYNLPAKYIVYSPQPYSHIRLFNYYLMDAQINISECDMLEWNNQKGELIPGEPLIRSYTAEEQRYYSLLDQQYKTELINLKKDIPDKEKRLQYLKTGL